MQMMTEKEAAVLLAVAPKTLRQWRCYGKGPRFYRYSRSGGMIRYAMEDLQEWLRQAGSRSGMALRTNGDIAL